MPHDFSGFNLFEKPQSRSFQRDTGTTAVSITGSVAIVQAKSTPVLSGFLEFVSSAVVNQAKPTITINGFLEFVGAESSTQAKPIIAGSGFQEFIATVSSTQSKPTLSISGFEEFNASISVSQSKPTITINGFEEFVGNEGITAPIPTVGAQGAVLNPQSNTGTVTQSKPALTVNGLLVNPQTGVSGAPFYTINGMRLNRGRLKPYILPKSKVRISGRAKVKQPSARIVGNNKPHIRVEQKENIIRIFCDGSLTNSEVIELLQLLDVA